MNEETLAPFALNYQLVGPMMRELAQLGFEGKVQGVAEKKGTPAQSLEIGAWKVNVSYGLPQFGFGDKPPGNPEPVGGAFVAQLDDNQFLVAGFHCRVDFQATTPPRRRSSATTCASRKGRTRTASSSSAASGTATRPTGASTSPRTPWSSA